MIKTFNGIFEKIKQTSNVVEFQEKLPETVL